MKFSEKVRILRLHNVSVASIAEILGVSRSSVFQSMKDNRGEIVPRSHVDNILTSVFRRIYGADPIRDFTDFI